MDVKTSDDQQVIRPQRFLDTPPFYYAKYYAKKHRCDLAVPNATGIGNVIVFSGWLKNMLYGLVEASV